jgi:cysteinyl-tRNA synthetase
MYSCGPTVYDLIHIGNARPLIVFDALRRYLEYKGYDVTFLQNFTDVDDKIINRANDEGLTSAEVSEKYTEEYTVDARKLGAREATFHPKATENIGEMIAMIEALIQKGLAYQSGSDVYFRTASFPEYGKLSRQPMDELVAGARVDVSEIKESPVDFALWKGAKPGEPFWGSPWGDGRPGWHIECSAMIKRYLGETIDIHSGGRDLIFPHHENEIAQSEGCHDKMFARYWLHNGFINIDNKKMAKSLGNFFTVREAAKEYGYENIRMFILMSHYRSPLNFSGDILLQSKNALDRIKTARESLEFIVQNGSDSLIDSSMSAGASVEALFLDSLPRYKRRFLEALDDDFNTADAIAVIFELIRESNGILAEPNPTKSFAKATLETLDELVDILGLLYSVDEAGRTELDAEVEKLIEARNQARKAKNWPEADKIRDELTMMGIALEDTPQGVKWKILN